MVGTQWLFPNCPFSSNKYLNTLICLFISPSGGKTILLIFGGGWGFGGISPINFCFGNVARPKAPWAS